MKHHFYKLSVLGNDFVLIPKILKITKNSIKKICDRRVGIGCDQLILLDKKLNKIVFYNQNGSYSGMCGNGIRAVAFFLNKKFNKIITDQGIHKTLNFIDSSVEAEIGVPKVGLVPKEVFRFISNKFKATYLDIGNPHLVLVGKIPSQNEFEKLGGLLSKHRAFRYGTNVHFVEKINEKNYKVKVWERGVGETLACGSGAVSILKALNKENAKLHFRGGVAFVKINKKTKIASMKSKVELVFQGEIIF